MKAAESNFLAWIAKAENDFLNIENNLSASRVPWDTVCFHAQQAVEKLLKAFLVRYGQAPPGTHTSSHSFEERCTRNHTDLSKLRSVAPRPRC